MTWAAGSRRRAASNHGVCGKSACVIRTRHPLTHLRPPLAKEGSAEATIRNIKRKTRRNYRVEEKIPIVVEGLRGEEIIAQQKAEYERLKDAIIALEGRLNDIVYDAFDLTPEERRPIEQTTKYPYGEV